MSDTASSELVITRHAIDRWVDRVCRVPVAVADAEIREFFEGAHATVRARRWMRLESATGDVRYHVRADRPGVALVVMDGRRVITVLHRDHQGLAEHRQRAESSRARERRLRRR